MSKPEEKHPAEYWIELFRPKPDAHKLALLREQMAESARRHEEKMAEIKARVGAMEAETAARQEQLEAQEKEFEAQQRRARIDREIDLELKLEQYDAEAAAAAELIEDYVEVVAEHDSEIAEIGEAIEQLVEVVRALTAPKIRVPVRDSEGNITEMVEYEDPDAR